MRDSDLDLGEMVREAISKAFRVVARDIELEGEAYFETPVEELDPNSIGATLGYPALVEIC